MLSDAQRELVTSLSSEPSRIGTRSTWTERKGLADSLPNGIVVRTWATDAHRYSLSSLGIEVRDHLLTESRGRAE